MYSGGFYPYETLEEYWAFWSRAVFINRYYDATAVAAGVYGDLLDLVKGKDYFVITINVDHCFQKAGFDKSRLFYTQGDYGLFQCSVPCHNKTYGNEAAIKAMLAAQNGSILPYDLRGGHVSIRPHGLRGNHGSVHPTVRGGEQSAPLTNQSTVYRSMAIPSDLIPLCPVCHKPMAMNLRIDDTFVEDDGWHKAAACYREFLNSVKGSRVVFLELGVGMNTPGIIKYPFWQVTIKNPNAMYICINKGDAFAPAEIRPRSICIDGDVGEAIATS